MFLAVGHCMKKFAVTLLAVCCAATPTFAASYPVSGRYGQSSEIKPGPIDCTGKRVIRFDAERRFDSGGGVPEYRLRDSVQQGSRAYRITEEFNTGQINAQLTYTLRVLDSDRIELLMSPGGTLKLKRCA
jgi:hypothetical protein